MKVISKLCSYSSLVVLSACSITQPIDPSLLVGNNNNATITTLTSSSKDKTKTPTQKATSAGYYHVDIISHDNTRLKATVYQPNLAPGETAPLIIHSHGFSVSRMSSPYSLYGMAMYSGKTALKAWEEGYWVISFDQRGHGSSEGTINLMSPKHEAKDVTAVIDWAIENIPSLAYEPHKEKTFDETDPTQTLSSKQLIKEQAHLHSYNNPLQHVPLPRSIKQQVHSLASKAHKQKTNIYKDPLIGMIGESYAGSSQLLASIQESRVDAIVPITTWYDLTGSLIPNSVPKSGWLTTLVMSGNAFNPFSMNTQLNDAYREMRKGIVSDQIVEELDNRSFKTFCNEQTFPQADALIMQGFQDTLFSFNHGIEIKDCFNKAGRDARLIGTQGGHLLPFTQRTGLKTFYSFEKNIHCGDMTLNTQQMVIDWFDEKLKQKHNAADYIPKLCMTLDKKSGIQLDNVQIGGRHFTFEKVKINSGFAGLFESALRPFDLLVEALTPKRKHFKIEDFKAKGGKLRPAFIPLTATKNDTYLAGIPLLNIEVTTEQVNDKPPTIFVGVGIKKTDSPRARLLNDQVVPITGIGQHTVELNAISSQFRSGEIVGLMVYSYNNQFRFSGSGWSTQVSVSGTASIPSKPSHPLLLVENSLGINL